MIEEYEKWLVELEERAVGRKKDKALEAGDPSMWKKYIWTSTQKNKEIKQKFTKEGINKGYRPRSSLDRKAREWLYDLAWKEFDEQSNLLAVKLAVEIELSDRKESGLVYDFNKLLQSDAEDKVFIFQQKTEEECFARFSRLESAVNAYRVRCNSNYLLAGWVTSHNSFVFKKLLLPYRHINFWGQCKNLKVVIILPPNILSI